MRQRQAVVRLLSVGDEELGNAIASGMMTARQVQMEKDAALRARVNRSLMRVDIGRGGWTRQDYDMLIDSARLTYAQTPARPSKVRRVLGGILGVYGLAVMAAKGYFNFDNERWKGV